MNDLTSFQRIVLSAIQEPLPISEQPFEMLALQLNCTEQKLLDEIRQLKETGWIRRFRPQIRYAALGRSAILAAAAVPDEKLEQTAAVISAMAGVSHNYHRKGRLNLWFTLQDISLQAIEATKDRLIQDTGFVFYSFPAKRTYKLDVKFDPAGPGPGWFEPNETISLMPSIKQISLPPDEKKVLEAIQRELPLESCPFKVMLDDLSIAEPLIVLKTLAQKGVLNKINAIVDYSRLGFKANAMVCMTVSEERIDELGAVLARIPAVTHCYNRSPYKDWFYNLYAMCHADTLERITNFVQSFCQSYDIAEYQILPTLREFKKKPVHVEL